MKGGMRGANKSVQDLNYKYFNNFFVAQRVATRWPLLRPLDLGLLRPGTQSELEIWAQGRGTIEWRAISDSESLLGPQAGASGRRANLPTSSCQCSTVPRQGTSAAVGQALGAHRRSGAGRFLVILYITIYAFRILITLCKTC